MAHPIMVVAVAKAVAEAVAVAGTDHDQDHHHDHDHDHNHNHDSSHRIDWGWDNCLGRADYKVQTPSWLDLYYFFCPPPSRSIIVVLVGLTNAVVLCMLLSNQLTNTIPFISYLKSNHSDHPDGRGLRSDTLSWFLTSHSHSHSQFFPIPDKQIEISIEAF